MTATPEILTKLSKLEIFSDFSDEVEENLRVLSKVCERLSLEEFKSGDEIISEGEYGDVLYILYDGEVQILRRTPGNEQFAVVNLQACQNIFFGEVALIDRDKRSASVVAISDCKTLTLTGADFLSLCEKEPRLGYKSIFRIAKRLAGSLRRSNADILTLYEALLDEVEGSNSR